VSSLFKFVCDYQTSRNIKYRFELGCKYLLHDNFITAFHKKAKIYEKYHIETSSEKHGSLHISILSKKKSIDNLKMESVTWPIVGLIALKCLESSVLPTKCFQLSVLIILSTVLETVSQKLEGIVQRWEWLPGNPSSIPNLDPLRKHSSPLLDSNDRTYSLSAM